MQALSLDQLVGQTLDGYRVERLLGKGRLNAVYLAQNLASRRTDALTLYLTPESFPPESSQRFLKRFLKGATAVSALQHPHILPVYAFGEYQGCPYLVTPYTMHGSLADELKNRGRYEHPEVLKILKQVASGLDYAHKKGYVHGTLKPSNIVLKNREGELLVAGFGLLHMLQSSGLVRANRPYGHLLSIADTLMIAPGYVAPEIVEGKSIDKRSDIYALGAILFELLSGQPPFSGKDPLEVAQSHVKQSAPALRTVNPDVPVALASVINQALERDPMRRFQRIHELVEAFEQVSSGLSGQPANSFQYSGGSQQIAKVQLPPEPSVPQQGTGSWQLLPPIVTGKIPVTPPAPSPRGDSNWLLAQPSAASLKLPSVQPKPAPQPRSEARPDPSAHTEQQVPIVPVERSTPPARPAQQSIIASDRSIMQNSDAASMQPFDWWSMAPVPETPDKPAPQARPLHVAEPAPEMMQDQMRVASMNADMAYGGQPMLRPTAAPRPRSKRRSGKVRRRGVLAAIVGGSVLVAGGAVAFDLLHAMHNVPTSKAQQNKTTVAGHAGTVVGMADMAANSAVAFTNPADNKASLLIRLPTGNFVAYERACTHQGVPVNYDPATQTLVCPLHGSIFDPAQGGQVLQGPATTALAPVTVHVNADGTVTTA
jgi:serine/threonine protein kinase/Rieske Fe-S protein